MNPKSLQNLVSLADLPPERRRATPRKAQRKAHGKAFFHK